MATLRIIFLMTISVSLADNQVSVTELQATVNSLKAETNLNSDKLNTMESQIADHVSVLRGMSDQALAKATQSMAKATQSMAKATQSSNEVTSLKDKIGAGTALFSVYMTEWNYPTSGQVIPFRGVPLNQGGHYSVSTYKFRCPRRGFYYFTFSIYSSNVEWGASNYRSTANLVLDGATVAKSFSQNNDPDHAMFAQGSNSAVVECPQGGLIWIKSCCKGNKIYGSSYNRETTFSGFLLSYL